MLNMVPLESSTISALVAVFLIYTIASRFSAWNRLRHIPGPAGAGWSRFWLVRHQLGGRLCFDLKELCDQYGKNSSAVRSSYWILIERQRPPCPHRAQLRRLRLPLRDPADLERPIRLWTRGL